MTKLSGWKLAYAVSLFCVWTAIAANAQTSELPNRTLSPGSGERGRQSATAGNKHIAPRFTNLANFEWNNGLFPSTSLIQSRDGKAFGVTPAGGNSEFGSIFEITPGGGLTSLHSFYDDVNGGGPSDLIQVNNGDFYGTTASGGANLGGTVFKLSREGTLTTLYNFCDQPNCIDGEDPRAPLVQGIDGDFYGTTYFGGDNGYGTVFRITPAGSLTTLHSFNFSTDGQGSTGLVQASNGTFYGTTEYGGPNSGGNDLCYLGCGTTFAMTSDGTFTTLYDFCGQPTCEDGYHPYGGLMQALDGNLYGTAVGGGNPSCKSPYGCGTVFKITPSGSLTTIHRFNDTDGANPYGSLIEAIDGNLYGTTAAGGFENRGTIFRITSDGTLTTVYRFSGRYGVYPYGGLLQGTNGIFYGTTEQGGDYSCNDHSGCGTVFSLDVGLGPFVAFVRDSGKAGGTGGILGQGFTGATGVSLNGTPASFTVVSDTFLKATVPAGATTGYATVTTPTGTLTSNVPFHVIR